MGLDERVGDPLHTSEGVQDSSASHPAPTPDQPTLVLTDEQLRVDTSKIIYTLLEEARVRGRRIRWRIKYAVLSFGLLLHLLGWLGKLQSRIVRIMPPCTFASILLISMAIMLLAVLPNERRLIGCTAVLALVLQIVGFSHSCIDIHNVVVNIRAARALRDYGAPDDLYAAPSNPGRNHVSPEDIWIRELLVAYYILCVGVFAVAALYVLRSLFKHRCTRYTLECVWSTTGSTFIAFASYTLIELIVLPLYISHQPDQIDGLNIAIMVATLITGLGMLSPRARARLMGWVAARCESSSVAAHMAMLMGGGSADVMRNATSRLRAISAELLRPTDLAGDLVARDVFLRSRPAHIGEIDAFISHSWRANPQKKWMVLSRWCEDFRAENGRMPLLWIDRLCIDPDDPAMAVGCLPVFVSACNSLVILYEPSFLTRLWCLVEVFCYLTMHQDMGSRAKIVVLDITVPPTPPPSPRLPRQSADGASSRGSESRVDSSWRKRMRNSRLRQSGRIRPAELDPIPNAPDASPVTNITQVLRPMTIESFDVRHAVCTFEADTVYLQDLIDAYPGGIILFNRKVRDLLAKVNRGNFTGAVTSHRITDNRARASADPAAAAAQGLVLVDKTEAAQLESAPAAAEDR